MHRPSLTLSLSSSPTPFRKIGPFAHSAGRGSRVSPGTPGNAHASEARAAGTVSSKSCRARPQGRGRVGRQPLPRGVTPAVDRSLPGSVAFAAISGPGRTEPEGGGGCPGGGGGGRGQSTALTSPPRARFLIRKRGACCRLAGRRERA